MDKSGKELESKHSKDVSFSINIEINQLHATINYIKLSTYYLWSDSYGPSNVWILCIFSVVSPDNSCDMIVKIVTN